jgi:hypothetical protein
MRSGGNVKLGVVREWFLRVMWRLLKLVVRMARRKSAVPSDTLVKAHLLPSLINLVRKQYPDHRVLLLNRPFDRAYRNQI